MINVGGASIWSEDLNNLLPFYRDILGLRLLLDTPGFAVFGEQGSGTPTLSLGIHSEVKGQNADPARHMVGLTTEDVEAEVARLKGAGVVFISEPEDFGQVIAATLRDPDSNLVQLLQFR